MVLFPPALKNNDTEHLRKLKENRVELDEAHERIDTADVLTQRGATILN